MVAPRIAVVQGSLTDGQEAVLVNASNTNLSLGSGVSGAIRGVREPTTIACTTLAQHIDGRKATHITGVTFYGFMLHEHMAITDVVKMHFPEASA
jgi:O-acetyl-ADP-ribose deacetylase (regulator of RNase III)